MLVILLFYLYLDEAALGPATKTTSDPVENVDVV